MEWLYLLPPVIVLILLGICCRSVVIRIAALEAKVDLLWNGLVDHREWAENCRSDIVNKMEEFHAIPSNGWPPDSAPPFP